MFEQAAYMRVDKYLLAQKISEFMVWREARQKQMTEDWFANIRRQQKGILWWKRPYTEKEIEHIWINGDGWRGEKWRIEEYLEKWVQLGGELVAMIANTNDAYVYVDNRTAGFFLQEFPKNV